MGMIDRYKKKGGFIQLVNLIETTGGEKREKFLKMIADESPPWEKAIKQKMITIERMSKWNTEKLMEILPQVPTMAMACAIAPLPDDKKAHFLGALSFSEKKKVEDVLKEHKPNAGEVASSQIKIINEVRNLVTTGKIKFEQIDPELAIPENFEEQLINGMADYIASTPSPEVDIPPIPGGGAVSSEEILLLRRKLVALTQENAQLRKEYKDLKDKVEGLKEAVRKIA